MQMLVHKRMQTQRLVPMKALDNPEKEMQR